MSSFLLDTNVLLRLADTSAPEHPVVRAALSKLSRAKASLFLAPQVLVELWVVATRGKEANGFGWSPAATSAALQDLQGRFPMLEEGPAVFQRWHQLVTQRAVQGKRAHDARLAAVMLVHGIEQMLTLNVADFKDLEVVPVHPSEVL